MFTKTTKVQFQDQQLDDYVLENSVLKSKLQSKIDALSIMSKELDKCSMERDRFKILVEQLKCKKGVVTCDSEPNACRFTPTNTISGSEILAKTRDHNNVLKLEIETLRSQLEEANGDILALRKQLQNDTKFKEINGSKKGSVSVSYSTSDYEQLVQELEKIKKKYQQIQLDYRATLDEKEELVSDRDYYKNKVQRLNHQISYMLSNRLNSQQNKDSDLPKPIVDIDALVTENKYLHERITQLLVEKEIVKRNLTKYKTLLDNRNKNNTLNFKKGFSDVMTQKQVREYLDVNSKTGLKRSSAAELKSLCLGLFEALNDKSIALQHQRKTNQILANRITELENTLDSWCSGQKCIPIFPSQMLLEEIITETGSVKSNESKDSKDKSDADQKMLAKNRDSDSDDDDQVKSGLDSCSVEIKYDFAEEKDGDNLHVYTKSELPEELQQLVREALAEMKSN